jgi:uroporphyrinogen decarboxylase
VTSYEGIEIALRGKKPDRVPVIAPLGLSFLRERLGPGPLFGRFVEDPLGTIVGVQEELGLDPVIWSYSEFEGEVMDWPAKLFRWPPMALGGWPARAQENWQVKEETVGRGPGYRDVQRTIATPRGRLRSRYRRQADAKWILDYPLKEEGDLEILAYRPDPALMDAEPLARMVRTVGQRAFTMHVVSGVWNEACDLRGMEQICYDVHDRPEWLGRLFELIRQRQLRQIAVLAGTGIPCIVLDETYVGMGISPALFEEFCLPIDRELVCSAQEQGLLVVFHNCGKARRLLDLMADTGADALETLTPPTSSGDLDLAEARERVGRRLCLCGGFDERVLVDGGVEQVRAEVERCLAAAARDGAYILRPAGQILAAPPENLAAMVETAARAR